MTQRILIDAAHPEEVRVALENNAKLEEFDFDSPTKKQIKSNIYLGKVTRVEPSLQAVFVEYGGNKQGFLPFSEVHFDYYQIPVADKKKLLAAMEAGGEEPAEEGQKNVASAPAKDDSVAVKVDEEEAKKEEKPSKAKKTAKAKDDKAKEGPKAKDKKPDAKAKKLTREEREALKKAEALEREFQKEFLGGSAADNDTNDAPEPSFESEDKEEPIGDEIGEIDRRQRYNFYRKYKIQEVLKRNQVILVQVIKEERGNKGASLTTYISLAGRYCVLMPNTDRAGGVSRRISDIDDRRRLKDVVSKLDVPKGASVIVRTAGVDRKDQEIKRDFNHLLKLWETTRKLTVGSTAPALIHEESNLIKRSLRDMYRNDVDEILVEGADAFKATKNFMKMMAPDHVKKIKEYKDTTPIFVNYKIDAQLAELYDNTAQLESGGSIVITPTEALVSIDVNSGKSTRGRSIEDTAVNTNIEAAREIARQIRLRDLAGLVVIDFIDMRELRNKRAVERALKDALRSDRAKIQVGRISIFGLVEMSRQRMRSSIVEASTSTCPECNGVGTVRSKESTALKLLRAIENEADMEGKTEVRLVTSTDNALYLLNNKHAEITNIEEKYGVKVIVDNDYKFSGSHFVIDKQRFRKHRDSKPPRGRGGRGSRRKPPVNQDSSQNDEAPKSSDDSESKKPSPKRGGAKRQQKPEAAAIDDVVDGNKVEGPEEKPARGRRAPKKTSDRTSSSRDKAPRGKAPRAKKDDVHVNEPQPEKSEGKYKKADPTIMKSLWKKMTQ